MLLYLSTKQAIITESIHHWFSVKTNQSFGSLFANIYCISLITACRRPQRRQRKMPKWPKCCRRRSCEYFSMKVFWGVAASFSRTSQLIPWKICSNHCSVWQLINCQKLIEFHYIFLRAGIAGQAGKKKSQNKLDAEKLGLLEQNKEVADMLDELSSDRWSLCFVWWPTLLSISLNGGVALILSCDVTLIR